MTRYCSQFLSLAESAEEVVLLPYTLSIVDCYWLHRALGSEKLRVEGPSSSSELSLRSAFDLYEFDRGIDEVDVSLVRELVGFIHWDRSARFVAIGGRQAFCAQAVPYPAEVQKHYFIEGSLLTLPNGAAESVYSDLARPLI